MASGRRRMGCVGMAGRERGTVPTRNVEEKRGPGMRRSRSRARASSMLIGGRGLSQGSDGSVFLGAPERVRRRE
jgi:hypothetical protein